MLDELARLRATGLAIGITVSGPRQGDTVERALETGAFDAVQATWNLLEPSAGPALAAAHDAGIGVIIKEALANGRLSARGAIGEVTEWAQRAGTTPDALALAAALSQPWADVVLSGAATPGELQSNLAALTLKLPIELLNELDQIRQEPIDYWSTRAQLPWN
jgi:aryl-alcohol dehydrogenase-like predicted oxidoreductase